MKKNLGFLDNLNPQLTTEKVFSANSTAILALVTAIAALAFSPIFIRISEQDLGAIAASFHCHWIAAVLLGFWNGLTSFFRQAEDRSSQPPITEPTSVIALLLFGGIFWSATIWCWFWSLGQTSIANATLLRSLTPIFVTLGGWLVWGKKFDRRFIVGMIVAIIGSCAIAFDDLQIATTNLQGDVAALICALLSGISLLILEELRTKLKTSKILTWRLVLVASLTLPIFLFTENNYFPNSWQTWTAIIAQAVICLLIGQGLIVYCLSHLSSSFVAVTFLVEPLLSASLAWVIFLERLNFSNWLAFFIVLIGIYLAKSSQSAGKI
ncbi:MAG: DMT family transporter [Oscillatoria sp. PMC 1068.18]|nr:DMT family transporter [Oscillatoria sp. PMC 1076.18]MEC4988118.1 DMT family transporter [Oscillatoria sp. PMC 1068.18]